MLPLRLIDCLSLLLGLALRKFQSVEESVLFFLLVHDGDLEVALYFAFLVELGLLGVEGFLQSGLVFLDTIFSSCKIALLSSVGIVLDHGLLQQGPQPHALINICLYLIVCFSVLTHFNVLLQLFDQSVFFLDLDFHVAILPFQLLNKEALEVVRLLADWCVTTSIEIVGLLLQLPCQVFDFLFLLAEVDMHGLDPSAQPGVLVTSDVELNLQIPIEVFGVLTLLLLEDGVLVGFADLVILSVVLVLLVATCAELVIQTSAQILLA